MFHNRTMSKKSFCWKDVCAKCTVIKRHLLKNFLQTERSVPIHIRNLQILTAEFFKESKDLAPIILSEIFSKHFSWYRKFVLPRTKNLGFSSKGALNELSSLSAIKKTIKKWKPQNYPCRLCKKYIQNLCFI